MGRVSIRETLIVLAVLLLAGLGTVIVLSRDGAPPTRWRFDLGAPLSAGPLLHEGWVYAAAEDGTVVALDAANGGSGWRVKLDVAPRGRISGSADAMHFRTDQGVTVALDLANGSERWRFAPGGGVNVPLVAGGLVVVAARNGDVYAFDSATGHAHWQTSSERTLRADPALVEGALDRVVIGDIGGRLVWLSLQTGELVDEWTLGGEFAGPVTQVDGVILAAPRPQIVALDDAGIVRWRMETRQPTRLPIVERNGVVYADESPDLFALDMETGALLWRYTSRALTVTFGIGDELAIAGMHTGEVHGIDLATGERVWRYRTNDSIRGTPTVDEVNGVAYFGSLDGRVYAIEIREPEE